MLCKQIKAIIQKGSGITAQVEKFQGIIFMKDAKDYIVFSLDVPSLREAEQYVAILSEPV